jgi:nicotinamide/nicotinate riboside kinase
MEQWLIVGISGITCGGKTTLASTLKNYFQERRGQEIKAGVEINRVECINQDNYFRPIDDPNHQKIEKLNHLNWEIIESINTDRMADDIMKVLGKKFVLYNTQSKSLHVDHENLFAHHYAPSYNSMLNYSNGLMLNGENERLSFKHVKHNFLLNILIIEGFLIFNHPVTFDICNTRFHLHVPYEVCFERRKKREYDPPDVLGYFEMVVWPEYEKNLQHFKHRKDVMFLNGEASPEKCFNFVLNSLINEL